jgi:hypothetical protein
MPNLRAIASHVTVLLIGVTLATAAGAPARPPKQPTLETRLNRLEARHDFLQSNYQTLCNTLKLADKTGIQDEQTRDLFVRMSDACWLAPS